MKRGLSISLVIAAGLTAAGWLGMRATQTAGQESETMPAAATIVKPHVYVSLAPVPRGEEFEAAIVVDIQRGYHLNSHKPTDPYLIPTTATPQLPAGIELRDTVYPAGRLQKFSFSPNKDLDVYTGSVTVRLKLAAGASAALGAAAIPVTLRYQACNDTACLPPVRVPVSVKFEVAAEGTKPRAIHPEIFAGNPAKQ
jgi:thioredoxin:protein disulfide reductase